MSFTPTAVTWRSHVADHPSPGAGLPTEIVTPPLAWDYGATTEPLTPTEEDGVLRLNVRGVGGAVGIAVLALSYGALLTQEALVRPEDGNLRLAFAFPKAFGPCRLLLRTYGDAGASRAVVLGVEVGRRRDLSAGERNDVHEAAAAVPSPALSEELIAWTPGADELFTPISLGNTCEAKFQIARVLQFRRWPDTSDLAFRLSMLPPERSRDRFGWELFDWQGASLPGVIAYLNADFQGVFEREDLEPTGLGVAHRRLGTEHMHDFEFLLDHPAAKVTAQIVDAGYPAARARFEVMAERFRKILRRPGPFLYVHVCEDIPNDWLVQELVEVLRAASPDHRFRLLFVGYDDADTPWGHYATTLADKAFRPRRWEKPFGRDWEGPDAAWDAALAPYRLIFPDGSAAAPHAG